MIERQLIRLATLVGATVWLARIVFSPAERRRLKTALHAADEAIAQCDVSRG